MRSVQCVGTSRHSLHILLAEPGSKKYSPLFSAEIFQTSAGILPLLPQHLSWVNHPHQETADRGWTAAHGHRDLHWGREKLQHTSPTLQTHTDTPQPHSSWICRVHGPQPLSPILTSPTPASHGMRVRNSLISSSLFCKIFLSPAAAGDPDPGWEMLGEASPGTGVTGATLLRLSGCPIRTKKGNFPEWIIALRDSRC